MAEPARDFRALLEDEALQREDILHRLCGAIQLTPTQHERAESAYRGVGRWLEAEGSPFATLSPEIYAQGSMALRTTNKPLPRDEHDLDVVVEVTAAEEDTTPAALLDSTRDRLLASEVYRDKVDRKDRDRCVRLKYAGDFHLDVVPALRVDSPTGAIRVPDRRSGKFKPGNPKGYLDWFEDRCSVDLQLVLLKSIQDLPDYDAPEIELPLRRCVQLLKRWRDVAFQDLQVKPPSSIVLTTLAANHYRRERSVWGTMSSILDRIVLLVGANPVGLEVLNPVDSTEILSESWASDPDSYAIFADQLRAFDHKWRRLSETYGLHELGAGLEELFGEKATRSALTGQQEALVNVPRKKQTLGFKPGTAGVTVVGAGAVRTPRNDFFGG